PVSLGRGEEHPFLGKELAQPKRYSERMAWLMDEEIRQLLIDAEAKATEILTNSRHTLDRLAEALIQEEVLDKNAVDRIVEESKAGDDR
ncbi:MAG TPA: hypothetical protein VJW95_07200, partial [Dissulfurispiraceae bacterium]|nr:hypothetical protein [Dissulfurispiraceae bacterium]